MSGAVDEPDVWWVIGPHEHVADVLEIWVHADGEDHKFCMSRPQAARFALAVRIMAGEPSVAQRCAPLVEALEWYASVNDEYAPKARAALAAHRAQEKAGGAEADRGE